MQNDMNKEIQTEQWKPVGKVWLLGAGPSDVELLTLKGRRLIEEAEVIVYDRLSGQGALMFASPKAELLDVGKRAGHHPVPQEEINRILVKKALEGKKVVRLKGGDPFVFGRGGEEAQALFAEGIPFEVVPGVTSAVAVPAYQGIPVTHRDLASSVHIITAHKKEGGIPRDELTVWAKLTGTLVFLMGVTALPELMEGLMQAGMEKTRPAAVLERGTTAGQRKITGTVGTIAETARRKKVRTPAVIVVGEVCALKDMEWYDRRPLAGMKILVTRPRERSGKLSALLREQGAEVAEVPSIRTVPLPEDGELLQTIRDLGDYRWIVFTSPTGAELFLELLRKHRKDLRSLSGIRFACIGTGTAKVLEERGIFPDRIPEIYDGEHLGRMLGGALKEGEAVAIFRAKIGSEALIREIRGNYKGSGEILISDIPIYETEAVVSPCFDYKKEFEEGLTDAVMFTSASTVRGFVKAAEGVDFTKVNALCIGRQTAQEAEKYGMRIRTAREASLPAMVELAAAAALERNELRKCQWR